MKKHQYQITIRDGETMTYGLENLNQIYGLLIGKTDEFRHFFAGFPPFRSWWRNRDERSKKALKLVEGSRNVEILIECKY